MASTKQAQPTPSPDKLSISLVGIGLRFLSCGLLALGIGLLWWRSHTGKIDIVSALVGVLSLLIGFIIGGVFWFVHDRRQNYNDATRTFSFVIFIAIPLFVLVLVLAIWLLAIALNSIA